MGVPVGNLRGVNKVVERWGLCGTTTLEVRMAEGNASTEGPPPLQGWIVPFSRTHVPSATAPVSVG